MERRRTGERGEGTEAAGGGGDGEGVALDVEEGREDGDGCKADGALPPSGIDVSPSGSEVDVRDDGGKLRLGSKVTVDGCDVGLAGEVIDSCPGVVGSSVTSSRSRVSSRL